MKRLLLVLGSICFLASLQAQRQVDLEECRQLALENNKSLKVAEENLHAAQSLSKAAFAQFFPNISAYGSYLYNQKSLSLLGEDAFLPIGVVVANGQFGPGIGPTSRPTPNADGTFTFDDSAVNNKFVMVDGTPVPLDAQGNPFDPQKNPENLQWKNHAILPK